MTSVVAIVLAVPVSLGIALYVNEAAPRRLRAPLVYLVELLAAVPSVVYGLWGLVVLLPQLQRHAWEPVSSALGFIAIFSGPAYGQSFATAGVILAIMIVPIVTAIAREVTALVPRDHKEAALALGATRWEMLRLAVLPYSRAGIVGGVMLGFGRALGETVAVALVIGGTIQVSASIFQPGYTIASLIASTFNEATGDQIRALVALGVLLFAITILVNVAGRLFVWRAAKGLR
jgi:phosphate transport system permease protein